MEEIWKTVPEFPAYEVSNTGKVRSYRQRSPRILVPVIATSGHHQVHLSDGVNKKSLFVHRLVLTLHGPEKPFPEALALHRDDMRANNHIDNLYWGTPKDNCADRKRNGRENHPVGEKHWKSPFTAEQVLEMRRLCAEGKGLTEVAKMFNTRPATVYLIRERRNWKHV